MFSCCDFKPNEFYKIRSFIKFVEVNIFPIMSLYYLQISKTHNHGLKNMLNHFK